MKKVGRQNPFRKSLVGSDRGKAERVTCGEGSIAQQGQRRRVEPGGGGVIRTWYISMACGGETLSRLPIIPITTSKTLLLDAIINELLKMY